MLRQQQALPCYYHVVQRDALLQVIVDREHILQHLPVRAEIVKRDCKADMQAEMLAALGLAGKFAEMKGICQGHDRCRVVEQFPRDFCTVQQSLDGSAHGVEQPRVGQDCSDLGYRNFRMVEVCHYLTGCRSGKILSTLQYDCVSQNDR